MIKRDEIVFRVEQLYQEKQDEIHATVEHKKVVIGLSGGVDSSVAAFLLQQEGHEVIGVTMEQLSHNSADMLPSTRAAMEVAKQLHIEHLVMDARDLFQQEVIRPFIQEYMHAKTPNPCVLCNPKVKWAVLMAAAARVQADCVATGHYSRIIHTEQGRLAITIAPFKDQSYCLYGLTQEQLMATMMPLGSRGLSKEEVRLIAKEAGIATAMSPDSQDICFIEDGDYSRFIRQQGQNLSEKEGCFVDPQNRVLGKHQGLSHYTIGQRKGLGIALGEPRYVLALRPDTNEVVLGKDEECFAPALIADSLCYMGQGPMKQGQSLRCLAKIRYAHKPEACTVTIIAPDTAKVCFDQPVRAITPGQAVVWYDAQGVVLGGGTIREALF